MYYIHLKSNETKWITIMSVDPQSELKKRRERERESGREDKRRRKGNKPILKQGLTFERFLWFSEFYPSKNKINYYWASKV